MLKVTDNANFKQRYPVEQRVAIAERIRRQFPECVPVILEPLVTLPAGSPYPNSKYAISQQYLMSAISEIVVGKHSTNTKLYIRLESYQSNWKNWLLSYFQDMTLLEVLLEETLLNIYKKYKHEDGLLYITYTTENN